MSDPIISGPTKTRNRLLIVLGAVGLPALLAVGSIVLQQVMSKPIATPATVIGAPVRAATAEGDRVFLMTSQWKTYRTGFSRSTNRPIHTDLLIDVWAFGANDARPVWRRRIAQDRSGVNMGRALLGAEGGVLWVLQSRGLGGLSMKDGSPVADAAKIETANPPLRGLVPNEERYYRFDNGGLAFTAADGRVWRIDARTLKGQPDGSAPPKPAEGVAVKARIAGGVGTSMFQERSLNMPTRWLGLMSDAEAERAKRGEPPYGVELYAAPRVRLWSARAGQKETFFGARRTLSHFQALPKAPDFLQAGILTSGVTNSLPILLFKPDSVLVLHSDRLGDQGRLQLTRVTGPLGQPMWTAPLPLQRLEAVMPGEGAVVLLGRREEPGNGFGPDGKRPVTVDQLVTIDLATGKAGVYGFRIKATNAEDIPPSSTR